MPRQRREQTEEEKKAGLAEGEFLDNKGYVRIRVKGAPGGNVMKHRVVMQEKLGRPLRTDERIKFLDGDKTNCHPGNLYITVNGQQDPLRYVSKLHTERRRLLERVEEIDKELKLINGQLTEMKPWEENHSVREAQMRTRQIPPPALPGSNGAQSARA